MKELNINIQQMEQLNGGDIMDCAVAGLWGVSGILGGMLGGQLVSRLDGYLLGMELLN